MPNLGLGYGHHFICYFKLVWPREKNFGHFEVHNENNNHLHLHLRGSQAIGAGSLALIAVLHISGVHFSSQESPTAFRVRLELGYSRKFQTGSRVRDIADG